jgi:gamma-glutamylcyclotransferase (GGCT)/AIG2-like uncharacterized protein YtfP
MLLALYKSILIKRLGFKKREDYFFSLNSMENLFSYGTLQQENVQLSTFKRKLEGQPDFITGYKLSLLEIKDLNVIATSGKTHHPIVEYTGNASDTVAGTVFKVSKAELLQADSYEVSDYKRVRALLKNGEETWVYVKQE